VSALASCLANFDVVLKLHVGKMVGNFMELIDGTLNCYCTTSPLNPRHALCLGDTVRWINACKLGLACEVRLVVGGFPLGGWEATRWCSSYVSRMCPTGHL
jgi:hypothetical protein